MKPTAPRILVVTTLLGASIAMAQASDPALATYGSAKVAASDYEASILRIPEKDRFGWAMSQERINKEIENLLRARAVANEGRKQGLDVDPSVKKRIELYADRMIAEALMDKIDVESKKEFDAKKSIFVERAREQYLINKQNYQTKPEVHASHLLITARGRSPEEALALTQSLRKQIVAGASFEEVAMANSEDSSVRRNKGDLGFFTVGQMDPAFEHAAFEMKKPGELSEPVRSRFGYHLILFHERKESRQITFEEATPELMEKLRAEFIDTKRSQFLKSFYDPAKIEWNEPAVAALRKTVDPALIKQLMSDVK